MVINIFLGFTLLLYGPFVTTGKASIDKFPVPQWSGWFMLGGGILVFTSALFSLYAKLYGLMATAEKNVPAHEKQGVIHWLLILAGILLIASNSIAIVNDGMVYNGFPIPVGASWSLLCTGWVLVYGTIRNVFWKAKGTGKIEKQDKDV